MNEKTADVVVITGASAGVGRATARKFAERGARIGLLARGQTGLRATVEEVEALGGKAFIAPTDVADPQQVEAAIAAVEDQLGPIDIVINNAMTSVFAPVSEMTPEEFRRVTEVTYLGQVYTAMAALKRMRTRNQGSIVFVGSALAYRGIPLQSAYCGAKHAIQGFFDSLRSELIHEKSKVKLSMVQLPALNTPQFRWVKNKMPRKAQPVPPIYQPEVAADAIVWAAYHNRRELTVGGMNALILWGNKFLPGLGDLYLAETGYNSQMTDETKNPDQPYNLWEPIGEDRGARGVFSDRAKEQSWHLKLNKHLREVGIVALSALAGVAYLLSRNGDEHEDEATG